MRSLAIAATGNESAKVVNLHIIYHAMFDRISDIKAQHLPRSFGLR
jgi:hypothetical protein